MANLLIVESPGKLKTLRKILGPGWLLAASIGHVTELASDGPKKLGFEFCDGRITTRYTPRGARARGVLKHLRHEAKRADKVYLATDPDREGEAIAWHLIQQLRLQNYERVSYTEITAAAVRAAIARPRALDLPLVQAQRARQCLDKLVGFEVSPLLWASSGGKSAGRVQSATLHLLCERERERQAFRTRDYWLLHAAYQEGFRARFERAERVATAGGEERLDPAWVLNEAQASAICAEARAQSHIVTEMRGREEVRRPLAPLMTSSLQQTAGVRLKLSPQRSMKIAQELYEAGLITYMRTDSATLSPEFSTAAVAWLKSHAPDAAPLATSSAVSPKRSSKNAQEAHEAIRPTDVTLNPSAAAAKLGREQSDVYALIWNRAVASLCRPARLQRSEVVIHAGRTRWVGRGMTVTEVGYLKFWRNTEDESVLPRLQVGQHLGVKEIAFEKHRTEPPPRYSEAKLVQLMEKLGIGRPSTYASTVQTLKDREYVVLARESLRPTELGMRSDDVLRTAIPELTDTAFTAQMETRLDEIAQGRNGWESFLCSWNELYFRPALIEAHRRIRGMRFA